MFPPPPYRESEFSHVEPYKVESQVFPDSLAGVPLLTMVNLEKKSKKEIIAAESLVNLIQINEQKNEENKIKKLVTDILSLQACNRVYNEENYITKDLYDFYVTQVCCDVDKIINISVETLSQSKSNEWYKHRVMRVTASSGHKLKGDRFEIDKVISELLTPSKLNSSAVVYGKKTENVALKAYQGLLNSNCKVIKVGLIINMYQPWLSCSPDAVVEYGENVWQKRLVEIKCPYKCRNIPVYDQKLKKSNVQYLKLDENGVQLSCTHSIYTQIQIQMYVTNIAFCDLFIYSPLGSVLITVARDELFLSRLIPKLEKFYFTYYIQRLFMKFKQ